MDSWPNEKMTWAWNLLSFYNFKVGKNNHRRKTSKPLWSLGFSPPRLIEGSSFRFSFFLWFWYYASYNDYRGFFLIDFLAGLGDLLKLIPLGYGVIKRMVCCINYWRITRKANYTYWILKHNKLWDEINIEFSNG